MGFQPRIPTTFESIDGLTVVTFATAEFQWQSTQPLNVPVAPAIGADWAHDFLGTAAAKRQPVAEQLQFTVLETTPSGVDTDMDTITGNCLSIGLGKLYVTASDGSRRWAYARAIVLPAIVWNAGNIFTKSVTVQFRRQSNWHDTAQTTGTIIVTTQGTQSFTLTNAGNVAIRDAVFRLRANAWHGFVTPTIVNATTGETVAFSRSADSADSEIKLDCGAGSAYYSSNDGATYADDYSHLSRGALQVGLVSLNPGSNTFYVCGGSQWPLLLLNNPLTQNYNLDYAYYGQYT